VRSSSAQFLFSFRSVYLLLLQLFQKARSSYIIASFKMLFQTVRAFGSVSVKDGEKILTQVFISVALCIFQVASGDVYTGTVYNVALRQNVNEGKNIQRLSVQT
jgi:hypothetical protein